MESLIRASCVNFRFCKRIALLVLVLCFAHPLTVSAQSDLTGFWVFRVPTGDGNFRETFLDLKQEGENITGKLLSGTRKIPIADGTFKEGKLHFVTRTASGDQVRQTVYEGTLNGDGIRCFFVGFHKIDAFCFSSDSGEEDHSDKCSC